MRKPILIFSMITLGVTLSCFLETDALGVSNTHQKAAEEAWKPTAQGKNLKPQQKNVERRTQQQLRDEAPNEWQRDRMRFLQSLGLSQEQRIQARQLFQRIGPKAQRMGDELEARSDAFREAIFGQPYDARLVEQRLNSVLEKQQELMRAQVEMELAFFEILTPEQQDRFREIQLQQLEIRKLSRQIREKRRHLDKNLRPGNQ